ncbi:hypothetical protein [Actinoallomurus iriomotensis]|nr:hypothetical protein [Actinoallomurus iriomotensis]
MDSIAFGSATLRGDVIVTGSHGGVSAGEYAASYDVAVVACNDAGTGKNAAGVAGLRALDGTGIAAVGVAHDSARIGDGHDTWENGVVSFVNEHARALGIRTGASLKDQIVALVDQGGI